MGATLLPMCVGVVTGLIELFFYLAPTKRPPILESRPVVKLLLMFLFFFLPSISRVVTSFGGCVEFDTDNGVSEGIYKF